MTLELNPADEIVLIEHMPAFQRCGFEFSVDTEKPCGSRVSMTAKPVSKQTEFGVGGASANAARARADQRHAVQTFKR